MSGSSFSPGVLWHLFLAFFSPLVVVGLIRAIIAAIVCTRVFFWLIVGILVYIFLDQYVIKEKYDFIKTFSHELNHMATCLMLFKRVHSFHAEDGSGVIYHTAGGRLSSVVIALAPYCLPLFTYVLLLVRAVMVSHLLWIVDILIGLSVGFYANTFSNQMGPHETDINQFTHRYFPYWYIFTFIAFNATILILSLMPNYNLFHAFADSFVGYWHNVVDVFNVLF